MNQIVDELCHLNKLLSELPQKICDEIEKRDAQFLKKLLSVLNQEDSI